MGFIIGDTETNPETNQSLGGIINSTPARWGTSLFDGITQSVATPFVAAQDVVDAFTHSKQVSPAQELLDYSNANAGRPGYSNLSRDVGSLAGMMFNPFNLALGEGVGEAAGFIGETSAKIAPVISRATTSLKLGGGFAGALLPNDIQENYDATKNKINVGGLVEDQAINAGVGMLLPTLPFAIGLVKDKLAQISYFKNAVKNADAALSKNDITQAEHNLFTSVEGKKNTSVQQQAAQAVLKERGIPTDPATGNVPINFLNPEDRANMQVLAGDQLAADVSPDIKTALSDAIIKGNLDDITANQDLIDGMKGVSDHLAEKINQKDDILAKMDKNLNLTNGLKADDPLNQNDIYTRAKNGTLNRDVVPKQVIDKLAHDKKIKELQANLRRTSGESQATSGESQATSGESQANLRRSPELSELISKSPKLLHPKDELTYLKENLTGKDKMSPSLKQTVNYDRLQDLATTSFNAQRLLDRVDAEHEFNRQASYKALIDQITDLADKKVTLSDPDSVTNYLKERVNQKIYKVQPSTDEVRDTAENVEKQSNENENLAQKLDEARENLDKSVDFNDTENAVKRYNDYKNGKQVLSDFIKCVTGAE